MKNGLNSENTLKILDDHLYEGNVIIKSTLIPETTMKLCRKYLSLTIFPAHLLGLKALIGAIEIF